MKDKNKIAVLVGLGLLFSVLLLVVPQVDLLRPLRHISPWMIFALFWVLFWSRGGCCGRRRCRPRRRYEEEAPTEA